MQIIQDRNQGPRRCGKSRQVKSDPENIKAIVDNKEPKPLKESRSFPWLLNYSRDFVPTFPGKIRWLNELQKTLKGETKKRYNVVLKPLIISKPQKEKISITYRAQTDFNKPLILIPDTSNKVIGGACLRLIPQETRKSHMSSKALDKTQENYSIPDKELLPAMEAMNHFKHNLFTDNLPYKLILKPSNIYRERCNRQRAHEMDFCPQDSNLTINYIPGERKKLLASRNMQIAYKIQNSQLIKKTKYSANM